jgi:hypothetical protein
MLLAIDRSSIGNTAHEAGTKRPLVSNCAIRDAVVIHRTADLLHAGQVLLCLSNHGYNLGADGRTRTCDELGVGQPI